MLGTTYQHGGIGVLSINPEMVPSFGLICDIFMSEVDNYFIVCEILDTECFCSHYHAYKIRHDSHPTYVFCETS